MFFVVLASHIVTMLLIKEVDSMHNCKYKYVLQKKIFKLVFFKVANVECGKVHTKRFGKIVGGQAAKPGEFPWMVSITRRGGHFCGGSLLTNKHILTAGHCMCR